MNDRFPTHHDQRTDDDTSPEQEYRKQIVGEIVEASAGSVGVVTPLNPTYDERRNMKAAVSERQQTADKGGLTVPNNPDNLIHQTNGWGSYGDRELGQTDKIWEETSGNYTLESGRENKKQFSTLQLFDLPDGTVDFRYSYRWNGYSDQSTRGSTLWTSFVLPKEQADKLQSLIEQSPDLIDDIIKAQVLAVGISEEQWTKFLRPRGSHPNRLPMIKKERTLDVSRYNVELDKFDRAVTYETAAPRTLSYADSQPLLPKEDEVLAGNDSAQEVYDFLSTSLTKKFEDEGITKPADKLTRVVEIINDYVDLREPTQPGSPEAAQQQAYEAAYQQLVTNYLQEDIKTSPDWDQKSLADQLLHVATFAATTHEICRDDDKDGNDTTVQRMFESSYDTIATDIIKDVDDESLFTSVQQPARDIAWNALQSGATENDIFIATSLPNQELDTSAPQYEELYKLRALTTAVLKRNNGPLSRSLLAWTQF